VNLTANVGANATHAFIVPGNLSVIADGANHPSP